jgi:hypothetical protein
MLHIFAKNLQHKYLKLKYYVSGNNLVFFCLPTICVTGMALLIFISDVKLVQMTVVQIVA